MAKKSKITVDPEAVLAALKCIAVWGSQTVEECIKRKCPYRKVDCVLEVPKDAAVVMEMQNKMIDRMVDLLEDNDIPCDTDDWCTEYCSLKRRIGPDRKCWMRYFTKIDGKSDGEKTE